jgi:hypothetical protein
MVSYSSVVDLVAPFERFALGARPVCRKRIGEISRARLGIEPQSRSMLLAPHAMIGA